MKLLHTSDWHLGKRLHKLERLPEQERFLADLIDLVKSKNVDHLLVAGDVFDVAHPPHKALKLFYNFIAEFISSTQAKLWVIAGNHDSGTLLDAPQGLINPDRVRLVGVLHADQTQHWVKLPFEGTHIDLCLLPYFRTHELAQWRREGILSENFAAEVLKDFLTTPPSEQSAGRVLLAHHLFGISEAAGSEQALALSGLESIPLEWLKEFDYAALGHIHKPQTLKKEKPLVRYPGSPLPLRFSETAPKGVSLLEWSKDGSFSHSIVPLKIHRPLYSLQVTTESWEEALSALEKTELPAAIELLLHLPAPVPGLLEMIRARAEELKLELLSIIPVFSAGAKTSSEESWTSLLKLTPEELFTHFYLSKYPEEKTVPTELAQDMRSLWEEARRASPTA